METLPELPSPLSLQFVRQFMEANILSHYRKLGCRIPQGVSSVRISHGRPYINVTLFQSLMAQLGSDPRSIAEYMGGEAPSLSQPIPLPMSRLPFGPWIRAVSVLQGKIWHAAFTASRWFEQLSRLAASQWDPSVEQLTEEQLLARMTAIQARLEGQDLTFAIVSGVSQAFYVIGATLSQRCTNWRALLNAATQGLGTIVSARQILWLQELAEEARVEPKARAFLSRTPWQPADFRTELTGTHLLDAFEAFLKEYGHRAIGESDVRSPRFAETPEYLLGIIRTHLMAQETVAVRSVTTILQEQAAIRATALAEIRERFGARLHQWLWFVTWYRTLAKFLALREANRHALMRYVAAARHVLQILGRKLSDRGLLETAEDLFYLTGDEIRTIVAGAPGEEPCRAVIQTRREERQRHAAVAAPQTIQDAVVSPNGPPAAGQPVGEDSLHGVPISAGAVEGPVRVVLTVAELQQTQRGEIVVTVALDPGMAPMFAVAAGLVVEIGGILSHGAIIAREYGIPALANVTAATTRLKAGDWVRLDADRGEVRRVKGPA